MDFQSWLSQAVSRLTQSDSPRRDAEILLEFITGKGRSYILAFGETMLTTVQLHQLEGLLSRRVTGEPVAYLLGKREFWSLSLNVSPVTLIPRPDTECLVEQALKKLTSGSCRILDLGTGTGAIALAIASECPECEVVAVDFLAEVVELAKNNAINLGIKNVHILQSDWFTALNGQRFSMIVSNPPYIDSADPHLLEGDVRFEPRSALVAEAQGLADLRMLIDNARDFLEPAGWLLLEHGWQQAQAVRQAFLQAGYADVETFQDYGGNDRLTAGRYF